MKRTFMSVLKSVLPICIVAVSGLLGANLPARAQEAQEAPENAMLVLDASGSMWGQIDGLSKIEIARDVVSGLLDNWNPKRNLGLMAYGHRRKGDCSDIQTLRAVGPVDPAAMKALVNALNPRGKTPISAAVRMAAEALKYSEEKATVILVSDGLETCAGDPPVNTCAMARELEEIGVDLTVHVVGFDLAGKDTASLECIAKETGGKYLSASNAGELSAALEVVAAPAPPGPAIYGFRATEGAGGPQIDRGLLWFLTNVATNETPLDAAGTGGGLTGIELAPGDYRIEVLRSSDEQVAAMDFSAVGEAEQTLTLVLAPFLPAATISGPAEAPAGTSVQVAWTGPDDQGDSITVVKASARDRAYGTFVYTRDGSPLELRLPETPGDYEYRYLRAKGAKKVLARAAVTVMPVRASLQAGDTVGIGASLAVTWTGPNNPGDYITIVKPQAKPRIYGNYTYTKPGSPLQVVAPDKPGAYEIRYVTAKERRILARRALVVEKIAVTLSAPPAVPLGSQVAIAWTGPGNSRDYITIVKPQAKARVYGSYAYTKPGSPVRVRAPETPGTYEIRYISGQSKSILATQALEVQSVTVTLNALPQIPAGSSFEVTWTGPDNSRDYITIVKPQARPREYGGYKYTRSGSPLALRAPDTPGPYELRYVSGAKKRTLATAPITVSAVSASLEAAAQIGAGEMLLVTWEGPNNKNDYITIVPAGSKPKTSNSASYKYTRRGSPLEVRAPKKPGAYELRYLSGQSKRALASRALTVR